MAKLACCEKIKVCGAMADGAATEFAGYTNALLLAVEKRDYLSADEEVAIGALFTAKAEMERQFTDKLAKLNAQIWTPLLT